MAFDIGSVVAHIKADVSGFREGLADAKKSINDFKSDMSLLTDGLKQLGYIGLAAGAAFTAFGIKAGFSAARIEELGFALNAVAKANGIAQKEVDKTVESLRKNNIAHEKALQITTLFIQSELDLADAIKLSNVAKDLAVISGQDSSEATRTLTEAISSQHPMLLRQYGIVKSLDQIYEDYAKTNTKTTMVTGESTKAYQKASGSVGELNDKLAIARQRLNEATASGKAKESTLMSLRNTVQNYEQKLASANGTMSQYAGKMISVSETSKNLSKDLTEAEKKQAFLNVILESGQKVAGTYDAAMGSVSKRFRSLTGRIIPDFIAQVGLAFQPAMVVIIDSITAKIKEMSEWLTANKDVVAEWGRKIGEAAVTAVQLFGFFVTFLSEHKEIVLAAFIAMGIGLAALAVAFIAAHAVAIGIVAAITLIILALKKNWDENFLGIRSITEFVFKDLRRIFNSQIDFIKTWGPAMLDGLTKPFRDAWNIISDLVNKIKNALDFTKRHSPSVVDIVNRGVNQVNSALAKLNIPDISSPAPVTSMGGVGSVIVNLGGAYIGDMATATRLAEKIGDGIIKKLNRNIRY